MKNNVIKKAKNKFGDGKLNANINSKVQKLKEVSQDRYKIYSLERKKNNNFNKIGELVYKQKLEKEDNQSEIDELIEENYNLEMEAKKIKKKIKQMESDTATCPNCDSVLPAEGNFCNFCGYKVVKELQEKNPEQSIVCPSCSETIPEGGVYCLYCGHKLKKQKKRLFGLLGNKK